MLGREAGGGGPVPAAGASAALRAGCSPGGCVLGLWEERRNPARVTASCRSGFGCSACLRRGVFLRNALKQFPQVYEVLLCHLYAKGRRHFCEHPFVQTRTVPPFPFPDQGTPMQLPCGKPRRPPAPVPPAAQAGRGGRRPCRPLRVAEGTAAARSAADGGSGAAAAEVPRRWAPGTGPARPACAGGSGVCGREAAACPGTASPGDNEGPESPGAEEWGRPRRPGLVRGSCGHPWEPPRLASPAARHKAKRGGTGGPEAKTEGVEGFDFLCLRLLFFIQFLCYRIKPWFWKNPPAPSSGSSEPFCRLFRGRVAGTGAACKPLFQAVFSTFFAFLFKNPFTWWRTCASVVPQWTSADRYSLSSQIQGWKFFLIKCCRREYLSWSRNL